MTLWRHPDHRVPECSCPYCGALNDGALSVRHDYLLPPKPGDVAVCAYCIGVSVYADDGSLRRPNAAEAVVIDRDPIVRRARGVGWMR